MFISYDPELKQILVHHILTFSSAAFLKMKSLSSSLYLDLFCMGALLFSETSSMANPTAQLYCGEYDYLTKRVYL